MSRSISNAAASPRAPRDQQQFPTMTPSALAQMICDPIEDYDLDWAAHQAANGAECEADDVLTAFMLERDARFRQEA